MAKRINGRRIALFRRLLAVWLVALVNCTISLHYLQATDSFFRSQFVDPALFHYCFTVGVAEGPEGLSQCFHNATLILGATLHNVGRNWHCLNVGLFEKITVVLTYIDDHV
jgi:hypothetical protein